MFLHSLQIDKSTFLRLLRNSIGKRCTFYAKEILLRWSPFSSLPWILPWKHKAWDWITPRMQNQSVYGRALYTGIPTYGKFITANPPTRMVLQSWRNHRTLRNPHHGKAHEQNLHTGSNPSSALKQGPWSCKEAMSSHCINMFTCHNNLNTRKVLSLYGRNYSDKDIIICATSVGGPVPDLDEWNSSKMGCLF